MLAARCQESELMDDPALDAPRHHEALRGLARINRWSRSAQIVWPPIWDLAKRTPGRTLRVLDVATGAGDVPVALWRIARRHRIPLELHACDRSPQAVDFSTHRAARAGAPIRWFQFDAFQEDWPAGYDVVMHSLFLHHLSDEQAPIMLQRMGRSAAHLVLVNDLVRSVSGLVLATVATRVLTPSGVVHTDARRSVRAAYTAPEAAALAARAGLHQARVVRRWPCRFLLTWERPAR